MTISSFRSIWLIYCEFATAFRRLSLDLPRDGAVWMALPASVCGESVDRNGADTGDGGASSTQCGPGLSESALEDLKRFLAWTGLPNPVPGAIEPEGFAGVFAKTKNTVGEHFLEYCHGRTVRSDYA
jgi:hypothetical protein